MATTQKKTGTTKRTSTNTTASATKQGTKKPATARKTAPPPKKETPYRREIGAVVCLILAVFVILSYCGVHAIFLDFIETLFKGFLGYGYWVTASVLMLAAYILGFHRGRPVVGRLCCALCLPLLCACFCHGIAAEVLPWDMKLVPALWTSGREMVSGGVLGGLIAQILVQAVSVVGATIVFVVVMFFLTLGAFNRSVLDIIYWFRNRPRYERQQEPAPREKKTVQTPAPAPAPARRAPIDIPVDNAPIGAPQTVQPEADGIFTASKKGGLFNRKPRVPTPAEALLAREQKGSSTPAETPVSAPQPVPQPAPEVVEQTPPAIAVAPPNVAPPMPLSLETEAPIQVDAIDPNQKLKKGETAQAAQEVAADIANTMSHQTGDQPYQYPPLSLLKESGAGDESGVQAELAANKQRLADTIRSFNIVANIISVTRGPSVTRYELELDQGVRLNKLTNLADDIALALGATGVRIAPIPDQISMVGIEVPNKLVTPVSIHEVIGSRAFTGSNSKVSFSVGKDIGGNAIVGNIAKLPHLLIAGTTGSGKSVCTNSLIISLLYKSTPDEVRLIMVDPKMVELGIYNGIPHLLIPVVTDPKKAAGALQWAVTEMMKRYRTFSEVGVRDLASYNAMAAKTEGVEKMPQIVVVIDELADLMLVAAKEVEESICRVAQMGRASGMHLIIATQRPSADVITGLMKANIPSRIAFAVASAMESRIILDTQGAEKLVGRGDMLYAPLGVGKPQRIQGCFISDPEVAAVVEFVKQSGKASYSDEIMHEIERNAAEKEKGNRGSGAPTAGGVSDQGGGDYDELIDAAAEVVLDTKQASVSMLQRKLKLGYARAARLVDQLEEKGIVGPFEGSKPRQLLITKEQWQEMQYRNGTAPAPEIPVVVDAPAGEIPPFDVDEGTEETEEVF